MIDLHTHSTASDGTLSPGDLVAAAEAAGLTAVALTDHDTVDGIAEARAAAVGRSVELVPGVEISAMMDKGALHIVGLFIDPEDPGLREVLELAKSYRRARDRRIVERLETLGMPVTLGEVAAAAKGGVAGRPHFASVMVAKGYVKSLRVAFRNYLKKGQAAYVPKQRIERRRAVEVIRAAGGVPVLAHPDQTGLLGDQLEALIEELWGFGLAGIETQCSGYTPAETRAYARLAETYHLVQSGGSDFHGAIKPGLALGRGPGGLRVPDDFLPPIRARAEAIQREARLEKPAGACGNRTHPARG
jgi:3',5'-nucleoside bisphosphate phosphatase